MKIFYLGNCGLLVTAADAKVCIDAPYGAGEGFAALPQAVWEQMRAGVGAFAGIGLLCFTHAHPDHCDRRLLGEYLRMHRAQAVLPEHAREDEYAVGAMAVARLDTRHSGAAYADVPHCSYLVRAGGKAVYVSGDADFNREEQAEALEGVQVDAGFFNPYHLTARHGRELLRRVHPRQVYIYHAAPADANGVMAHARRCWQRERETLPPCAFLVNQPGWEVEI